MNDQNEKREGKSLAELAVQRRQEIRKKKDLSDAAKLLFDDLTDIAFLSKFSVGFGVVRVGKPLLAERLGKSVPTITRAQKELSPEDLWTKTGWHEGHEITIWFLRGIADGQLEFDRFTEGVTRAPRTRVAPRVAATRNGHGQFCTINGKEKSPVNGELAVEMTGHPGQSCRGATVNPAVATRSNLTVVNRQNHRSGPVKSDRSERSNLTVVNGQNHRNGHGKNDGSSTAEVTGYKEVDSRNRGIEEPLPTDKQFQDWLESLDGLYPSRLRDLEKTFTIKLRSAQSPEAKAEWKRRLEIVQERLLGGPVEDKGPKPVRVDRKPAMTFEQQKKAWEAAKKDLPDQLRKKAAGGSAARS